MAFGLGSAVPMLKPVSDWVDPRRNALMGLSAGFLQGDAGAAMRYAQQGSGLDRQYAAEAAAQAQAEEERNATAEWLQKTYPQFANLPPAQGFDAAMKLMAQAKGDPLKVVGDQIFDTNSREWITPPGADMPDMKDQFGYEKDLYAQYTGAEPVKAYQGIKGGYEKLQQAAAQGSGPGDMSLIFGFMKMLDPTSTVREGEYASAQNSGGIPAQIQGLYNKAIDGQFLTDTQRQEFLRTAEGIYQETVGNLEATNSQFSDRAAAYKVDPSRFLVQPEKFETGKWVEVEPGVKIRKK